MTNPQVFKEFQEARKNNIDPQEYLGKITNNFNQEQKQELMQSLQNSMR